MQPEKKIYEVQVAGLSLKLRSSHDQETVEELAEFVDHKIQEALSSGQNISFQNALLLAALHIAEDLRLLKHVADVELGKIEGRAQQILSNVESSPISRLRLDN